MKKFGDAAFEFLKDLKPDFAIPDGISCLLPFEDPEVISINKTFYKKFYNDNFPRKLILGINPGRFGSGVTGISFTDPVKLETELGIKNSFAKRAELSSDFIYQVITQFGGPEIFFRQFYITAVCPIGFISDSKNINYYDNKELTQSVQGFIIQNIELQLRFGIDRTVAFCLGEGENFKFLNRLNTKYRFFEEIIPLAHPRFIMQYRRKLLVDYVNAYLNALNGNNSLKMQ